MPDATPPPESAPASGATCLLVDCGFSELATNLVLSRHQLIEMYLVLAMIELSGEATNTNFIVFGFTQSGLEPTIYCTRGEHTITPLMWLTLEWSRYLVLTAGVSLE
jgi:hypothetical protein